ncbi:hypothetical protein Tco_1465930 [Tanacetum coccineum]
MSCLYYTTTVRTAIRIEENSLFEGNFSKSSTGSSSSIPTQRLNTKPINILQTEPRRTSRVSKLLAKLIDYNKSVEPTTYDEITQNPKWIKDMNDEIAALYRNNTWIVIDLAKAPKQWNAELTAVLIEHGFVQTKPVTTPFRENIVLNHKESDSDKLLTNITEYQKLYMHSPLQSRLKAALRVLRPVALIKIMKKLSMDQLRESIGKTGVDIFEAIEETIKMAACDLPNEFKIRRPEIAEELFSCKHSDHGEVKDLLFKNNTFNAGMDVEEDMVVVDQGAEDSCLEMSMDLEPIELESESTYPRTKFSEK